MVLTVRQRGQLLLNDGEVIDDVVAVVWFEGDETSGSWGGIVEPALSGVLLRAQVAAGQREYRLLLEDGRQGTVAVDLSEFDADGANPLAFRGLGALTRR